MMEICDWIQEKIKCEQWAQYQIIYPDKTARRLCATHKDELLKSVDQNLKLKIYFCGAMPKGTNISIPD